MNRRAEVGRENRLSHWRAERDALVEEAPPRFGTPPEMPELRPRVRSRTGRVVQTSEPLWLLDRDYSNHRAVRLNVDRLYRPWMLGISRPSDQMAGIPRRPSVFSEALIHACMLYLARCVEKHTGGQAQQVLNEFVALESFLAERPDLRSGTEIEPADLTAIQYLTFVRNGGAVKRILPKFYSWSVGQGFAGFDLNEMRRLKRVPVPTQPKGVAVRSRDPKKGALTWDEQQALGSALRSPAPATSSRDHLITWLFFELGARPIAVARLRNKHFQATPLRDGYTLDVPKVKQNGPTEMTVKRKISRELGDLATSLGGGGPEDLLLGDLGRDWAVSACRRFSEANDLRTPRVLEIGANTLGRLPLSPYRLRYTMATNLAEQGASPEQIAAMLDDKTLAMALVYTSNTSELVDILEETLDNHPAWLRHVGLFLGKVDHEPRILPVIQGGVPYFASYERWSDRIPTIGWCSNPEPCDLRPPLSCYRCGFFLADPDAGAHVLQLAQLKDEVRSQIGIESDRMAKVLRPDLFAIAEVIAATRGGVTNMQRVESRIARSGATA